MVCAGGIIIWDWRSFPFDLKVEGCGWISGKVDYDWLQLKSNP